MWQERLARVKGLLVSVSASAMLVPASAGAQEGLDDPIPGSIRRGQVRVRLEPVAEGLTAPNWGTAVPGCHALQDRLIVTDQDGIVWALDTRSGEKSVWLDVSDRLVDLGVAGPGTFDERGLLGIALHPSFSEAGLVYTYTSEPVDGSADFSTMPAGESANHQSVVREWQVPDPCNPGAVVNPESDRELLRIDQPQFNHDAGAVTFGPDGALYVSLGDGGNADDQGAGHVPDGNGQDPGNILGTIIRIDPGGDNSANGQYGIPVDNPFVGQPGFLDEIYAYGFRNPFRFSFDAHTGEMLIADVGQNDIEEIDIGRAGGNYGWRLKEGSFCFDPNGDDPGFVFECSGGLPADLIDPVAEYDHDEGIAVVGGFVYRGSEIPSLFGRYVFGDFFAPSVGSGRLFYLQRNDRILELRLVDRESLGLSLLGFGQDASGELYVLANETGTPFGDTGVVLGLASGRGAQAGKFTAHLSGDEENPPVETQGQGEATFSFRGGSSALDFKLIVANLEDVVAAHVHCGAVDVNGPVGITLFSGGPTSANGVLADSMASAPDAGNGCGWTSLADAKAAMRNGLAYVNVHTLANPAGEIRGQIR